MFFRILLPGLAAAAVLLAQQGTMLRSLRLKLSAGDLLSAESILEVHRRDKGEDSEYLQGLAWLARGAAMLGDCTAAKQYGSQASVLARAKSSGDAEYVAGTSIEVEAQCLASSRGKKEALRYLEDELTANSAGSIALRSRIWKRWNQIGLVGTKAPDVLTEPRIAGKPAVLFLWAEWCGDCLAQSATLRKVFERYAPRGVEFLAVTRFYTKDADAERAKAQGVWRASYSGMDAVPLVFSEDAMVRYGVSATPTFVVIDRKNIVRFYSPTRLTEDRLSAAIDAVAQ